jgi:hypothetical protein
MGGVRGNDAVIRAMQDGDVVAVVKLAEAARLLHAGWDRSRTGPTPGGRGLRPLLLTRCLGAGTPALVADLPDGRIAGAVVARPLPSASAGDGRGDAWAIDDFYVDGPSAWTSAGLALLVALAGRAVAAGVAELRISCPATDSAKAAMLAGAALARTAWLRTRTLTGRPPAPPAGVRAVVDADADALAPLLAAAPRPRHTLAVPAVGDGPRSGRGLTLDDGSGPLGIAVVGPGEAGSGRGGAGHRDATVVADPIALAPGADWAADGARLIRGVEWLAANRGEARLAIPCGPGDEARDEELAAMGYSAPLEWWTLDLRGASDDDADPAALGSG